MAWIAFRMPSHSSLTRPPSMSAALPTMVEVCRDHHQPQRQRQRPECCGAVPCGSHLAQALRLLVVACLALLLLAQVLKLPGEKVDEREADAAVLVDPAARLGVQTGSPRLDCICNKSLLHMVAVVAVALGTRTWHRVLLIQRVELLDRVLVLVDAPLLVGALLQSRSQLRVQGAGLHIGCLLLCETGAGQKERGDVRGRASRTERQARRTGQGVH